MELIELSISEAAGLMARGEISPVELTRAYLEQIQALDPLLNCYLLVQPEAALESARRAEAEFSRGEARSPLQGIPMGIKDLYDMRGLPTTAGSTFFTAKAEANAAVVDRLEAAGAVLLGKQNMHEIALGVTSLNPHFGPVRNPWNPEHIAGGSSGGSGAALAARMCAGALGSDTGGSIRIPASLCGVVGLKPTFGRVSLRGVIPLSWNLDHAGPMARRVLDVAILLQEIAGYDPADPGSVNIAVPDYLRQVREGVAGWRIALAAGEYFSAMPDATGADPVRAALEQAALVFARLGARVEAVDFDDARQAAMLNSLMTTSDAAAFHQERLEQHPDGFGADVLERLRMGAARTSSEYAQARRTQAVLRHQFEAFFQEYDLLLAPTTVIAAPLIAGQDAIEQARRLTRYTAPFNFTGLPALSMPCGFTSDGLPLGLQIVSGPWNEAKILRSAFAYEQSTDWHLRRPLVVENKDAA